jgi:hypothetical protein
LFSYLTYNVFSDSYTSALDAVKNDRIRMPSSKKVNNLTSSFINYEVGLKQIILFSKIKKILIYFKCSMDESLTTVPAEQVPNKTTNDDDGLEIEVLDLNKTVDATSEVIEKNIPEATSTIQNHTEAMDIFEIYETIDSNNVFENNNAASVPNMPIVPVDIEEVSTNITTQNKVISDLIVYFI